jgi:hypothetical protein
MRRGHKFADSKGPKIEILDKKLCVICANLQNDPIHLYVITFIGLYKALRKSLKCLDSIAAVSLRTYIKKIASYVLTWF